MANHTNRARLPVRKPPREKVVTRFDLSPDDRNIMRAAAQRRGITETELMRRLIGMLDIRDKTEGGNVAITLGDKLVSIVAGL
jgi:hypothetical protein